MNNPPCARCGHRLWEHSTGECDIHRCDCPGYMATGVFHIDDDDRFTIESLVIVIAIIIGFGAGRLLLP